MSFSRNNNKESYKPQIRYIEMESAPSSSATGGGVGGLGDLSQKLAKIVKEKWH